MVRDNVRVQLQGDIHLVWLWPREGDGFHALTILGTKEKEGRSWIASSGPRGHLISPSNTMTFRFGTHGDIARSKVIERKILKHTSKKNQGRSSCEVQHDEMRHH